MVGQCCGYCVYLQGRVLRNQESAFAINGHIVVGEEWPPENGGVSLGKDIEILCVIGIKYLKVDSDVS